MSSLSFPSGTGRCCQLAWCFFQLPAVDPGLPRTTSLVRICKKLNWLKPLEGPSMETSLRHCLSTLDLILLGVDGTVSSDLYMLSGTVPRRWLALLC